MSGRAEHRATRRPGRAIAALAAAWLAGAAGRLPAAQPGTAEDLSAIFAAGRAAVEDGLYELAEIEAERYLAEAGATAPLRDEAMALLARSLYEQGRYEKIIEALKGRSWLLWRSADRDDFPFWRALAYFELERFDEALAELDDFADRFPDSPYRPEVERLTAWCLLRAARTEEALAAFARYEERLGEVSPPPRHLLQWAKALAAAGRLTEARNVLSRLAGLPATDRAAQEAQEALGQVLVEQKRWDQAAAVFAGLGGNAAADPDLRARAWFMLAVVHAASEERAKAVDALRQGIETARTDALRRRGGFAMGRLLLDLERLDEAIPPLKTLIAEAPEDPLAGETQLQMAWALLDQDRCAEAAEAYQHHLETFTNRAENAEASAGRGWALLGLQRHVEAAAMFEKASDLFDDPARKQECLFKVGDAYFAGAQYEASAQAYRRFLALYPSAPLAPGASLQVGEALVRGGQPERAEPVFADIARAYPGSALGEEGLLRLAETRAARGRWQEALGDFDRVTGTYSNGTFTAEALLGRGRVLFRLFRFREALAEFERVVREFADRPAAEQAFYLRGMCHFWMGNDQEAIGVCRQFIQQFPGSRWAPEVLFWMAKFRYNRGDPEAAEQEFLHFAQEYPAHDLAADSLLWAGHAALQRKEYTKAVELLTRMVKEYPASGKVWEARVAQAEALYELARFADAILICDEVINKCSDREMVGLAWTRKGECQFILGKKDARRYEESIASYRAVAASSDVSEDLVFQAEYKIGQCLEKQAFPDKACEQYYVNVVARFLNDRQKGIWHNRETTLWFTKAAFKAAEIMEAKGDWKAVAGILGRVADAGVSGSEEAARRRDEIRSSRWWLF